MLASFVLALREGLEAALIIGILLGTLKKLEQEKGQLAIWSGTGLAVLVSLGAGFVLNLLGARFEGRAEEIFEGITLLSAAGILTWVILWMRKNSRQLNRKLEEDVKEASLRKSNLALFSLAFLAVIREGVELAFFLSAVALDTNAWSVLIGAILGLAGAGVIALLLSMSLIQLDLKRFFHVTSIVLILFAAGLIAHGVHEFNEVGWIPPLIDHIWDINHLLDERSTLGQLFKALLGYNGDPSLTEVIAYFLYYIVLGLFGAGLFDSKRLKSINQEAIL